MSEKTDETITVEVSNTDAFKEGQKLYLSTTKPNENHNLRPRDFTFSIEGSSYSATTNITVSSSKTKSSTYGSSLNVGFGRNFGYFEAGFGLGNSQEKGSESTTSAGLNLTGNLIENAPGNDFIPYLSLGLGTIGQGDTSQTLTTISIGLLYFPVGEIYALSLTLYKATAQSKGKTSGISLDFEGSTETTGLSIGHNFYF